MHRGILALVVMVGLAGCGPNEDNWSEKSAKASCKFSKRCAEANFYNNYSDLDDCETQSKAALDAEALEKSTQCIFDDGQAKACLDELKMSCKDAGESETFLDPCFYVWNCGTLDPTDTTGTTTTSR